MTGGIIHFFNILFLLFNFSSADVFNHRFVGNLETLKENLIAEKKEFIEVHLEEMKIRKHKDGVVEKEFGIFRKGDPDFWGGTAAGLYFIDSKSKLAYSSVSEVYMPWSIKIFGKYYIHGEPYYADGSKMNSLSSGGCIQLLDKEAKLLYELVKKNMPLLIIDKKRDNYRHLALKNDPLEINAKSYLVADIDSGYVFSSQNEQEKLPIASLTKLMTATVIAESVDLRKSIFVTEEMLKAYGSVDGLISGKGFGLVELFYPLLIQSSNDAAEALAGFLGKKKTVDLMNQKARAIMMENTEFVDTSGLDEKNKSCAKDLFYLARYIIYNRPPIFRITRGEEVGFSRNTHFKKLKNKNLFYEDERFIGGKTGFIKVSGYVGVFVFRLLGRDNNERNIAIIILGAEKMEKGEGSLKGEVEKILKWLESNHLILHG